MPDPISSNSSAPIDHSSLSDCDPNVASCPPPPTAPPASSTRTVTLDPVYVVGDAGPGAQALVQRGSAQLAPSCTAELASSAVSCPLVTGGVLTTIAASPSIVGGAAGLVATFGLSVQCGKDIASYIACKDAGEARSEIEADCDARGGVALAGASPNTVICLVTQ